MKETIFEKELFLDGSKNIFVFGSNERGAHGAGAALFAESFCGARYGIGFGLAGNSFAIPTKDYSIKTLPLEAVASYVRQFLYFAEQNPDLIFYVTRIGCGLAGFTDIDIAPLFKDAPDNCILPDMWKIKETNEIKVLDKAS